MRFELKTDEVPVGRINEFRLILDRFLQATTWRLYLPPKVSRLSAAGEIGALPAATEGINAYVAPVDVAGFEDATHDAPSTGSPTVYHEQKSEWHGLRYAIPILFFVALAASRQCSQFDSSPNVGSLLTREMNAPRQSGASGLANLDETTLPLPTGPALKGPVYSGAALDQPPVALYQSTPIYPPELLAIGVDGEVLLDFVVTDEGLPTQIKIVTQTGVPFGRSATIALLKWVFRPATKDGKPVNAAMRVPISFRHDPNRPQKPLFDHRFQGVDKAPSSGIIEGVGKAPRQNP
jgi:protein TonB